jgi:phage protein U
MFAQLGKHIFQGLKSPAGWDETIAERYGKIALVNGKDVLQHTGEELVEIGLSIDYSIEFCDPSAEVESLKQSMQSASILPFITGEGVVIGDFVITGMDISHRVLSPEGRPELTSVSLSLLEHARGVKKKTTGVAMASARPTVQTPAMPVLSPSNAICTSLSSGTTDIRAAHAAVIEAKEGKKTFKQAVREVRQLSDNARRAYASAKTKIAVTQKIAQRARRLPTSLDEAIRYAENLASVDNLSDMTAVEMNVEKMRASAEQVTADAAPVVAFSASREGGN